MTNITSTLLVPGNFKIDVGSIYKQTFANTNNDYYLFVAEHVDRSTDGIVAPVDTIEQMQINVYHNMIMGKRITSADTSFLIKNNPYQSNAVYTMYDDLTVGPTDADDDITDQNFCIVNASSNYHVFKCLDNNMSAYSTVEPDFSHISGSNTAVYQTSDGYRWKYMYSVSSAQKTKFATSKYFPIIANTEVEDSAVSGAIDIIKIETTGLRYDNYFNGTLSTEAIRIDGNNLIYAVVNSISSSVNGFYTDCLLYLSSGTGSGQYKTITNYFANSTGKFIVVNSAFTTTPVSGTQYQITPRIAIIGSGDQTVNAVARALVNSSSGNSIYRVEMLERGVGYTYATANVSANSVVVVAVHADIRPIYSPAGGHGSDPVNELKANKIILSVQFQNTESNTILTDNQFQQIGIIKNPLFSNVVIGVTNVIGMFISGETLYKVTPRRFNRAVGCNTTSNVVTSSFGDYVNQVAVDDTIIISTLESDQFMIANVSSIINSSTITISSNGLFACSSGLIYYANTNAPFDLVDVANSTHIVGDNMQGLFQTGDRLIGEQSGTLATIDSFTRNGVEKNFDTFIQLHKYTGSILSGAFEPNEVVEQLASNAILHSAVNRSGVYDFYTSMQIGEFIIVDTINTISGATSGAIGQLQDKYQPELVFGSGDVLMLENIQAKTRSNTQTETFKTILDF